ncbi:hypothetical protein ACQUQU_01780 [Thalassolituus sp. LLYu03]|uniref:hypothetical protein n=1 Tax=Thalassolituus sp. LLYu03 TaxID=3421656 RepID=UPI003D2E3369
MHLLKRLFVIFLASHAFHSNAANDPGVSVCLMVSDVILFRGEQFNGEYLSRFRDEEHRTRTNVGHSELSRHTNDLLNYLTLVVDMKHDELFPWKMTSEVSARITPILLLMPEMPVTDADIARLIAYLNMQYVFRAYVGTYELPRELNMSYLSWDETDLVPVIDKYLTSGDEARYARWNFLKKSFLDMNSANATLVTVSGRPYAPVVVDFHSRALIRDLTF